MAAAHLPSPVRVVLTVLVGLACGAGTARAVLVRGADDARLPTIVTSAPPVSSGTAREVLRGWDARRAEAWHAGDRRSLAALYTPGSRAGQRDVAMLGRWAERGRRVTRLVTQVLRLRAVTETGRRLVLLVTDRLAVAEAGTTVLPRDGPTTRRIELRRGTDGVWRVASVTAARW